LLFVVDVKEFSLVRSLYQNEEKEKWKKIVYKKKKKEKYIKRRPFSIGENCGASY
jgi:hypothetical protein